MSDDPSSGIEASDLDASVLEEWVTNTADQKGIPEQELLDEVLSSYWVLEELADVIATSSSADRGETRDSPSTAPPDGGDTSPQDTDDGVDISGLKDELTQLRTAIEGVSPQDDPGDPPQNRNDAVDIVDLLNELNSSQRADAASSQTENRDRSVGMAELLTAINSHHSAAGTDGPAVDNRQGNELRERLDDLETRMDDVERQISESITDTLSELDQRITDTREFDSEFRSRINAEFEEIENVLDHLLDATSDMDHRLESANQSHQAKIEQLQEYRSMQNRLESIKSEAITAGITAAECESCTQEVDLALLETPFCPRCDSTFTDLSPGSWVPFDTSTLHVDSESSPASET